ncbi:hypothetical protein BX285_6708 [Streptomyces sp. 1114.5]|uniref:hypothetical protein n=1 Tax=Streptomyces sp. 1114.5 TaxID=1938830 RepID=UPI000EAE5851|nr:hypothetical protein [Streptomyces sp. 1114.5]RKT09613.1 hypothetical protein BX285_6708 [Streptomyces sp. 1114.5]
MAILPVFCVGAIVLMVVLTFLVTPSEGCRSCKHQRADHRDGTGSCSGDDFDVGELYPNGRICPCPEYRGKRRR